MSEKLLRMRVYDDDSEMLVVYDAYVATRENSKSKRGHARRGVESEFVRRLLIAGYRHLYGEFPRPNALVSNAPSNVPSETARPSRGTHVPPGPGASVDSGAPAPVQEKTPPPSVDLTHLLKAGARTQAK